MATLQERIDNALALRKQGYNCAQCVAMIFDPSLEAATGGLGTGIGGTGHICGAATAMALVTSSLTYNGPADKPALYARVRECLNRFAELNCGDTNCCDLRKPGRKPCVELIKDAVTILHETYAEKGA